MGLVPSAYVNKDYPLVVTPAESHDELYTKFFVLIFLTTSITLSFLLRVYPHKASAIAAGRGLGCSTTSSLRTKRILMIWLRKSHLCKKSSPWSKMSDHIII